MLWYTVFHAKELISPSSGLLQQYGHCFTSKDNGTRSTRSCWTTLSPSLAPLPPTHNTTHTHTQMMPHPQGITHSDMVLLYQCMCANRIMNSDHLSTTQIMYVLQLSHYKLHLTSPFPSLLLSVCMSVHPSFLPPSSHPPILTPSTTTCTFWYPCNSTSCSWISFRRTPCSSRVRGGTSPPWDSC